MEMYTRIGSETSGAFSLIFLPFVSIFAVRTEAFTAIFIALFCFSLGAFKFRWGTLLVAQLVEVLRYKPEGRGFDSRWRHWNFSST